MNSQKEIIITTRIHKQELIASYKDLNCPKIYSLEEFIKLFYFDYDIKTIAYIMKKYHVIYDIAQIYLKNLYFLKVKKYQSAKLNFLCKLKEELLDSKYLYENKLFLEFLKDKQIILASLPKTKELDILIKDLQALTEVKIIPLLKPSNQKLNVYEFKTLDEEVIFVSSAICDLLKSNHDIQNIYLCNLNPAYHKAIEKYFFMYNIPVTLNNSQSIYSTYICNVFFRSFDTSHDLNIALENSKRIVKTPSDQEVYNKIVQIVNNHIIIENEAFFPEILKTIMQKTYLEPDDIKFSVHEVSLEHNFQPNDYVFILGFNQGSIPRVYQDIDYLNNKELEEAHLTPIILKQQLENKRIKNLLNFLPNVSISYKLADEEQNYTVSNLISDLDVNIIKDLKPTFKHSNLYNQILLNSLKDEFNKYGKTSNTLYLLNNNYPSLYNTYSHNFTKINSNILKKYLNNELTLSYSTLDKYYRCPYSYYLANILKLNVYENTFFQEIGNIFHNILQHYNHDLEKFDTLWQNALQNSNYEFNAKELFFLKKLKQELKFVLETITNQEKFTMLHDELHEQKLKTIFNIDGVNVSFVGIVDKIKYQLTKNTTTAAIIDYKTGSAKIDLPLSFYGINMQLPIYLYLVKNNPKLQNLQIAGIYLQKILNNEISGSKNYIEEKKNNLLLQGYSLDDPSVLSVFDTSYKDSNIIKSLKLKNDGSFYSYSKVLSSSQFDCLYELAQKKIKEGARLILNAQFSISPKKIGKDNLGCKYCKFQDICYMQAQDEEILLPLSLEEFFQGGTNGMD